METEKKLIHCASIMKCCTCENVINDIFKHNLNIQYSNEQEFSRAGGLNSRYSIIDMLFRITWSSLFYQLLKSICLHTVETTIGSTQLTSATALQFEYHLQWKDHFKGWHCWHERRADTMNNLSKYLILLMFRIIFALRDHIFF